MQRIIAIAGYLCALLAPGPTLASGDVQLAVDHDGSTITLRGSVSSAAHESILQKTLAEQFQAHTKSLNLVVRPAMPPGWALITDITLKALAETRSASADVTPERIELRGYAADKDRWSTALQRISDNLLPGMLLDASVIHVGPAAPLSRQCIELFRTAMRGRRIEFAQASADLGTSASPLLDELVQIAADCPGTQIDVIGHTDSTGDESINLALSQARADAVAAYMIGAGIPAARIVASGAGSAEPLVDETGPQARRLNRRIEVELKFPQPAPADR